MLPALLPRSPSQVVRSGAGGGGHGFPLALPLRVLNSLPPSLTLFPGGRLGNGQSERSPACGGAGQKCPLVLVQPKLSEQEPAEGEPGHRQGHWGLWASGLGLCYGAVTGGRGPGQPSTSSGPSVAPAAFRASCALISALTRGLLTPQSRPRGDCTHALFLARDLHLSSEAREWSVAQERPRSPRGRLARLLPEAFKNRT